MNSIEENNRLIAEFMKLPRGIYPSQSGKGYWTTSIGDIEDASKLLYHESWEWLMVVVDKIESIIFDENNSYNVTIGSTNYCVIQDSNGEMYDESEDRGDSKLETTYIALVEFIKWYNK